MSLDLGGNNLGISHFMPIVDPVVSKGNLFTVEASAVLRGNNYQNFVSTTHAEIPSCQ